ncbi:hybrid sensor histidine kinase/response regulator [Hydrogenophaga sp. SL48]|jgi:signal transduction histidine kinase|uniref:hybrid sensor histidine kinase/response regulator n=1 Tax=Hydrogenophaga sp. SL48 TaxID=2806347 RepID=UPI001F00B64B|nr:response regulator [Hydrogenophaga sp. SL48]UJW81299.1 response regulator [Hydrogenophaga sp. SL48]
MSEHSVSRPLRILHLEDSRVDHALVKFALQRSQLPHEILLVDTMDDFLRELDSGVHDFVLADYHLPGFTGLDAWELVRERGIDIPFVILSGAIGETAAVDAMHRGVSDYLLKDSMNRLAHVIQRAVEVSQTRKAKAVADAELADSRRRLAELAEHLQTSIDQERADISREIHDDIGGALAAVKLDLSWVSRRTLDADVRHHMDAALEMLQHALDASQRIMMNLRPPILDQGLVAAVQWLAASFEKRAGVRVTVRRSSEQIDVPRAVQLVAYRTAQEALTNVAKHANATAVEIDLSDLEGVLTLEVTDNGQGLSSEALKKAKSFGLLGLKERAAKVDGWLDISSTRRGTSVILSVPLATPSSAEGGEGDFNHGDKNNDQSDFV